MTAKAPVSYTHLHHDAVEQNEKWRHQRIRVKRAVGREGIHLRDHVERPRQLVIPEPVSYTHLDVYKRQEQTVMCKGKPYRTADGQLCHYSNFNSEAYILLKLAPIDVYKRQVLAVRSLGPM